MIKSKIKSMNPKTNFKCGNYFVLIPKSKIVHEPGFRLGTI